MSIRVMTAVWDRGKRYEGGSLLVLLALADWADDGGRCYPSVTQLAEKSRLTERQVYSVLRDLKGDRVLEPTGEVAIRDGRGWRFLKGYAGGRGRTVVYRLNTEMLSGNRAEYTGRPEEEKSPANPEMVSGKTEAVNPEAAGTKTLKLATRNPEVCDNPPHPLLGRTVKEPSNGTVKKLSPPPPAKREGKSPETTL
ncbi:MAG: helix-turn-helix domain-containing protein, partial [Acidobacteriaceae bacterium]